VNSQSAISTLSIGALITWLKAELESCLSLMITSVIDHSFASPIE